MKAGEPKGPAEPKWDELTRKQLLQLEGFRQAAEAQRKEMVLKALAEKTWKTLAQVRAEESGGAASQGAASGSDAARPSEPVLTPASKAMPKAPPPPAAKAALKHRIKKQSLAEWQDELEYVLRDCGTLGGVGIYLDSRLPCLPTPFGEFVERVVQHFAVPLNPDERHRQLGEASTLPPSGAEPGQGTVNWPFNYHGDLLPINPVGGTKDYMACSEEAAAWVRLILHQLNFSFCAGARLKDPANWRRFYTKGSINVAISSG